MEMKNILGQLEAVMKFQEARIRRRRAGQELVVTVPLLRQGRSHLARTQTEPHTLETAHVGTLVSRVHGDRLFPFEWHSQERLRQPTSSEQTQPRQCWRRVRECGDTPC